jgi:hypothetical protein
METPRTKGMNNFEAETLIRENKRMQKEIYDMEKKIIHLRQKIKSNEPSIFKICNHEWEYDPSAYMDRTKYFCKKCKLWRNSCWYQ